MTHFIVIRSLTRKYGYTVQAPPHITWAKGPQNTVGWYRRKSDAQQRADELNRAVPLMGNCTRECGVRDASTSQVKQEKRMIAVKQPLFRLGLIVSTPGALRALQEADQSPWEFLSRHVAGDWGIVDDEDKEANNEALKDGSRILSAYLLKDGRTKIWIITEAEDDNGNRAATTLLLPDEY